MRVRALLRGFGIAFLGWGIAMFTRVPSITGLVIIEDLEISVRYGFGLAFIVVGIALFTVGTVDVRARTARRRLIDLMEGRNDKVSSESAFNLVDRYEHVKHAGIQNIRGRAYQLYEGKVKHQYGGGKEYFTVDKAEPFLLNLPGGRQISMPTHIDVQDGKMNHHHVNIPWREFLEDNKDVLERYHTNADRMLSNLEHREKKRRAA